ncbi:MAG: Hypothetical protein BHV28_13810 [Candidatus Tokpelaia hoelldobleri]|uniref:Uncharacterized protein n=1 Tax=Candidatus Tokpelaia hoelldobleri TaxID=1902579 RepID=A0A1U9JW11_9HYPH|nr:MAG: Hypothetical protein BHV28_13810 [Candidatus Tokpelaia hoelldoblerii]
MAKSGSWLGRFIKRVALYTLSLCVILVILAGGVFYFFRPSLTSYAASQVKKYGIETGTLDISPFGSAEVTKLRLPLGDDGELTAQSGSVRPPVPGFSGKASLYNVVVTKKGLRVTMPELYVDGLTLADKDPSISSRSLQMLMRVGVASVTIPGMQLMLGGEKNAVADVRDIRLSDLSGGRIRLLSAARIEAGLQSGAGGAGKSKLQRIEVQSGGFSSRDIDLAGAYGIMSGKPAPLAGKSILGVLTAKAIRLDATLAALGEQEDGQPGKAQNFRVTLDSFEVRPDLWQKKLPQSIRMATRGFYLDTTELDPQIAEFLREAGYDTVEMSALFDVAYDETAKKLNIRDISFSGKRMGAFSLKMTMDNVGKDVFDSNSRAAARALMDTRLLHMTMVLRNDGLIDRTFSLQKMADKAELQEDLEILVEQAAEVFFGGHKDYPAIKQAMLDFVRATGSARLTVDLAPRKRQGVSLAEIMGEDPVTGAMVSSEDMELAKMLDSLFDIRMSNGK